MATKLKQDPRIGSFTSDLGEDVLAISRFEGSECLSGLFEFRVDVVSEDKDIDFDKILGTNCGLHIYAKHDGVKRHFRGVLVEAQWTGMVYDLRSYRLILRPWLWLLTRTTNCRIFSNKTVPGILQQVFQDKGFDAFQLRLNASYPELEYCVQYRESDFSFVSRLMEEYGIYYYFEHGESGHELIMADSSAAHEPKPAGAKLALALGDAKFTRREDTLNQWTEERKHRSGKVTLNDYDYEKPSADLKANRDASSKYALGKLELYDYPGRYTEKSDGLTLANIRLEAEQAADKRSFAEGDAVTCCPGFLVELAGPSQQNLGKQFLTLRADHAFQSLEYRSAGGADAGGYSGRYEFLPVDIQFRAPAVTPKPIIYGPQTALVASDVDDECRIEVQFYWDRDKTNSRYVRIAHGWAGNGWGDVKIPRIGMEVVVEYLDGDPDYPLVTGSVYNNEKTTPVTLPSMQTQSTIKSRSSKSGTAGNEIRFEDKKDSEEFYFHAQKDMKVEIENMLTTTVKASHEIHTLEKGDRTVDVQTGKEVHKVKGTREVTVTGNETHKNDADFSHTVAGKYELKITGDLVIDVTGSITIKTAAGATYKAGTTINIDAGTALTSKAGTAHSSEAGTSMKNKSGLDMSNEAGTGMKNKASTTLDCEAAMVTVKASATGTIDGGGMLTVKGGLVKIN